jgi:hypothetical protein
VILAEYYLHGLRQPTQTDFPSFQNLESLKNRRNNQQGGLPPCKNKYKQK